MVNRELPAQHLPQLQRAASYKAMCFLRQLARGPSTICSGVSCRVGRGFMGLASQFNFFLCFAPLPSTGVDYYFLINILYCKLCHGICFQRIQPEQLVCEQSKQLLLKEMWNGYWVSFPKGKSLDSCSHIYAWKLSLHLPPGWWPECGTQLFCFSYMQPSI